VKDLSYCPKCGSKIDEETSFCPKCGAALKAEAVAEPRTIRRRNEKSEKDEKNEKDGRNEKSEKHEKHGYSFLGPLIGGLVLIFIGLTSYLQITQAIDTKMMWAFFFVIVGVIIIIGGIFGVVMAGRRHPRP
jgi:uncharacterized membrane protein YvbJ